MKRENVPTECICKEELGREKIYIHLSWCPQDYGYKEEVERYFAASWWKKPFMYKPWNHPHGI